MPRRSTLLHGMSKDSPPLWQCPLCHTDAGGPTTLCSTCGCHLLLLAKIRMESWQALARAEEARAGFLAQVPPIKKKTTLLLRLLSFAVKREKSP